MSRCCQLLLIGIGDNYDSDTEEGDRKSEGGASESDQDEGQAQGPESSAGSSARTDFKVPLAPALVPVSKRKPIVPSGTREHSEQSKCSRFAFFI